MCEKGTQQGKVCTSSCIQNPTTLVPWKPMPSAKRNKKNPPSNTGRPHLAALALAACALAVLTFIALLQHSRQRLRLGRP